MDNETNYHLGYVLTGTVSAGVGAVVGWLGTSYRLSRRVSALERVAATADQANADQANPA